MTVITRNGVVLGRPMSAAGAALQPALLDDPRPRRNAEMTLGGLLGARAHRETYRSCRFSTLLLSLGFDVYRRRRAL